MFDKSISDGRCPICMSDTVLRRSFIDDVDSTRVYRACKNKSCSCLFKIETIKSLIKVSECESELDYGDFDLNAWEARHRMNCTEETDNYFIYINKNSRTMISKRPPDPAPYNKRKNEVTQIFSNESFNKNRKDFDYETKTHMVFIDGNKRTFIAKNFGEGYPVSPEDKAETIKRMRSLGTNINAFVRNK